MKRPDPTLPFQHASAFAARKHIHQTRRDHATPYFSHCARVALTVAAVFQCDDEIALAAAFLHDTIEDTTTDFDELAEHFGEEVAIVVAALTKNMALPDQQRETEYDARLAAAPWQARIIKLADQYDNLSELLASRPDPDSKKLKKSLERCHRALTLAEADTNPAVTRAREVLIRQMSAAK